VVGSDGGVFAYGGTPYYGSMGGTRLNAPIVGLAPTAPLDWGGYREVASDGGIFSFGNAVYYGSMGGTRLNAPIVGMRATPDGKGYWLVAADGGIFAFGDAHFFGSMGGTPLNAPIVGMTSTSDGRGYWLVAADGGVFTFGDAHFEGSTGNLRLMRPIVSIAATATDDGYLLTAADGGVFAFGDSRFYGSIASIPQPEPIVGMAKTLDGGGYWFVNRGGGVTAEGDATYWGSTPQALAAPIVGIVLAPGNGSFSGAAYPAGSYGYDISNYQCGDYPPPPHTVSIVQVAGASFGAVNPCLRNEANWAGAGLNLYAFLTYGASTDAAPGCANSVVPYTCNFGYAAGVDAFAKALSTGIDTKVSWWLDVENPPAGMTQWSTYQAANAALIQGYMNALHAEGINSVGIYASPGVWPGIVGGYTPAVPYWAADWGPSPAATCGDIHSKWAGLPTGPVEIVQYGIGVVNGTEYDEDYAC